MSPYRERNELKRESGGAGGRKDRKQTDSCNFEVIPAISNTTLSYLMGVHFVGVTQAKWRAKIIGKEKT